MAYKYPLGGDKRTPAEAAPLIDALEREGREADAEAFLYFSPLQRDQLFDYPDGPDTGIEPIREWRIRESELEGLELALEAPGEGRDSERIVHARVRSLRLYRYFNGIYMLAVAFEPAAQQRILRDASETTLGPPSKADRTLQAVTKKCADSSECYTERSGRLFADDETWWRALALSPPAVWEQIRDLQLDTWLGFSRLNRILYPSFLEQVDEFKIARRELKQPGRDAVTDPPWADLLDAAFQANGNRHFSPVLKTLLMRFFDASKAKAVDAFLDGYREFADDRMFVSATYVPAGPKLDETRFERVTGLALHVDRSSDGWSAFDGFAYNPEEVRRHLANQTFRLWEPMGNLYGFTDHSNVWIGRGSFFRQVIAYKHVPAIYERMLLQGLFYRASLQYYARRIAEVSGSIGDQGYARAVKEVEALRADFMRFTNQYWFHDLTQQMQGRAIFALQQEHLGLQREYEFIKEEMERTDDLMRAKHDRAQQQWAQRLGIGGAIVALLALWVALLEPIREGLGGLPREWTLASIWRTVCDPALGWLLDCPAGSEEAIAVVTFVIVGVLLTVIAFGFVAALWLIWRCIRRPLAQRMPAFLRRFLTAWGGRTCAQRAPHSGKSR